MLMPSASGLRVLVALRPPLGLMGCTSGRLVRCRMLFAYRHFFLFLWDWLAGLGCRFGRRSVAGMATVMLVTGLGDCYFLRGGQRQRSK
jgi:hypothetical protein